MYTATFLTNHSVDCWQCDRKKLNSKISSWQKIRQNQIAWSDHWR